VICLKAIRVFLVGIVLAGLVTDARALDPNRLPSQYVREQWITGSSFPGGTVTAIGQSADGYLWIGTDRGLIRFDGFSFTPVSFTSITAASNVPILQLLVDAGGNLWIRPQGTDVVRQKGGRFESVGYGAEVITSQIAAMSKDINGGVLISDTAQGIFRFLGDDVQKLASGSPPVISLAETAEGKIWMGTLGDGLFFLAGGRAIKVNAGLPDRKINCLLAIGSDELWVGTDTGLYRGNGKAFRQIELPSVVGNVQVLSILRDRDSNIWVGTARGLLRINAKGISLSKENELRGNGGINVLFEDREGNLWIGGARGLGCIRASAFVSYPSVNDPRFEHNGPIYVDKEGHTWIAPVQGGLYVLQNGRVQLVMSAVPARDVVYSISGGRNEVWLGRQRGGLTRLQLRNGTISSQTYTEANGLAQNSVYAVYESRDGSVWAGTLSAGVSKLKDGRFTTYTTTNGLASNSISSILETRDGGMWFATPNGLSSFSNDHWRTYTTVDGLPSPEVNCLFEDSSGILWSGTSGGLAFFGSGHFQVPHEWPEALREQIVGMAEDKSGGFWISTSDRVLRIARDKLLSGVVQVVDVREYSKADGLESTRGVKRSRSVVSDSAGRIWFSLDRGLSVVDPSEISDNSVPALPHIEAITADNNTANLAASAVRVGPSPKRIMFEYTGLSLAVPGRIRFRYFLEGFDNSWSPPVAAREAVYTNLGPGSYRFRLVASNSEGLWNGPETAIVLNVTAAYHQTVWFRSLCVFAFLALLAAIYELRLRQVARRFNIRMEERVNERTRIARDLHDTLLQSFQGALLKFYGVTYMLADRPEAQKSLENVIEQARKAISEGRDTVYGLRSSTVVTNELAPALSKLGEELARENTTANRVDFRVHVEGTPRNLSPIVRDEVYRIACEAVRNAFHHACAARIELEIGYDRQRFRLRVRDNGKGIDPKILGGDGRKGHYGLPGMHERARLVGGKLAVCSELDSGTEAELTIPASVAYAKSSARRRMMFFGKGA